MNASGRWRKSVECLGARVILWALALFVPELVATSRIVSAQVGSVLEWAEPEEVEEVPADTVLTLRERVGGMFRNSVEAVRGAGYNASRATLELIVLLFVYTTLLMSLFLAGLGFLVWGLVQAAFALAGSAFGFTQTSRR